VSSRDEIIARTKALGVKVADLLVLAPQRDPYYIGTDSQIEKGEWFARLYEEQGIEPGYHLRRLHYRWQDPHSGVFLPNGKPFVSLWTISTPIYPTFRPETWTPPPTPASGFSTVAGVTRNRPKSCCDASRRKPPSPGNTATERHR
jgi:hypothetical protein